MGSLGSEFAFHETRRCKKISDVFLPKNRPHPQVAACGWKSVKRCTAKQSKGTSKWGYSKLALNPPEGSA